MTRTVLTLAASLALLSSTRIGHATTTCGPATPITHLPRDGATDVPRNARLLASGQGACGTAVEVTLEGPDGARVELAASSRSSGLAAFTPTTKLAANTRYNARATDGQRVVDFSFTTSATDDLTPPDARATPSVEVRDVEYRTRYSDGTGAAGITVVLRQPPPSSPGVTYVDVDGVVKLPGFDHNLALLAVGGEPQVVTLPVYVRDGVRTCLTATFEGVAGQKSTSDPACFVAAIPTDLDGTGSTSGCSASGSPTQWPHPAGVTTVGTCLVSLVALLRRRRRRYFDRNPEKPGPSA